MKLKSKLVRGYFCAILYADPRILYSSNATTGFNKTPGHWSVNWQKPLRVRKAKKINNLA